MENIKKIFNSIKTFLYEVKVEMGKVAWPSQSEVKNSTVVVIVSVFMFSVFVWVFDLLLSKGLGMFFR